MELGRESCERHSTGRIRGWRFHSHAVHCLGALAVKLTEQADCSWLRRTDLDVCASSSLSLGVGVSPEHGHVLSPREVIQRMQIAGITSASSRGSSLALHWCARSILLLCDWKLWTTSCKLPHKLPAGDQGGVDGGMCKF